MFNFINAYISNYLLAYWSRNFGGIAQNLLIIMVFKQVIMNVIEYFEDRSTSKKIQKIKKEFEEKISEEKDEKKRMDLDMHSFVE